MLEDRLYCKGIVKNSSERKLKMFIKFQAGKQGGIVAFIDRKVSFPERSGPQPQADTVWEVEVVGQNKSGSVNFLHLVQELESVDVQRPEDFGVKDFYNFEDKARNMGVVFNQVFVRPDDKEKIDRIMEERQAVTEATKVIRAKKDAEWQSVQDAKRAILLDIEIRQQAGEDLADLRKKVFFAETLDELGV